jgi:hypothetical protein
VSDSSWLLLLQAVLLAWCIRASLSKFLVAEMDDADQRSHYPCAPSPADAQSDGARASTTSPTTTDELTTARWEARALPSYCDAVSSPLRFNRYLWVSAVCSVFCCYVPP